MKLAKGSFLREWERIARRFGRKLDAGSLTDAEDYYRFLSVRMTAEEFLLAAEALWATSKWFPTPAAFLTVGAAGEWRKVLGMARDRYSVDEWHTLSTQAKLACEACGGLDGMGQATNIQKLREGWMEAYALEMYSLTADNMLVAGAGDVEIE